MINCLGVMCMWGFCFLSCEWLNRKHLEQLRMRLQYERACSRDRRDDGASGDWMVVDRELCDDDPLVSGSGYVTAQNVLAGQAVNALKASISLCRV